MSDTEDRILDSAQALLQSKGYSAISYQDISNEVGIRKASIHYYFPSKGDLVKAVIERYRENLGDKKRTSYEMRDGQVWDLLADYAEIYLLYESEPEKICLCGALAGEYLVLPDEAQLAVRGFFDDNMAWLKDVIVTGQKNGDFRTNETADYLAGWAISTLQGALLLARTTGEFKRVVNAYEMVRDGLRPN